MITNRSIEQAVRLKEDESTLLSGIMDREETKALSGAPALSTVPGAGYLFGNHNTQKSDVELLIVLTPRRVRLSPRIDKTIYAGQGDRTGRGVP